MRPPAFAFALAGVAASPPTRRRILDRNASMLAFDAAGFKRRAEEPPPRKPVRRDVSPAARIWSWVMVGLLVAALVLPFSLEAVVDLVRYLGR